MYRPVFRAAPAASLSKILPKPAAARRFLSTAPPHQKSRSWKSSAVRWGAAGALVYYYNTATAFAEEPICRFHPSPCGASRKLIRHTDAIHAPPETTRESETYPTIETVAEQRRSQAKAQAQSSPTETATVAAPDAAGAIEGSPEGLEEEAGQQGAFNEETGEINWDCPCLGGMANGPCGEQFKAAFSCFVYSKDEPKGVDCIEHFKTMQNCFREHPDVYGSELEDDEAPPPPETLDAQPAPISSEPAPVPSLANMESPHGRGEKVSDSMNATPAPDDVVAGRHERAQAATKQVEQDFSAQSESDAVVPKAWHDSK